MCNLRLDLSYLAVYEHVQIRVTLDYVWAGMYTNILKDG